RPSALSRQAARRRSAGRRADARAWIARIRRLSGSRSRRASNRPARGARPVQPSPRGEARGWPPRARDTTLARRLHRYGPRAGLAYWLFLTRDWFDEAPYGT